MGAEEGGVEQGVEALGLGEGEERGPVELRPVAARGVVVFGAKGAGGERREQAGTPAVRGGQAGTAAVQGGRRSGGWRRAGGAGGR